MRKGILYLLRISHLLGFLFVWSKEQVVVGIASKGAAPSQKNWDDTELGRIGH